ncbi:MAG: hypothetical protein Q7T16_02580 [Candidatus Burarchaeum sp.]|nr:hypothetical protein [Candidatus Burarchaeum sp.]MDO8339519.1 hypothetical protein [Candidatus Burarchaeum sp.]
MLFRQVPIIPPEHRPLARAVNVVSRRWAIGQPFDDAFDTFSSLSRGQAPKTPPSNFFSKLLENELVQQAVDVIAFDLALQKVSNLLQSKPKDELAHFTSLSSEVTEALEFAENLSSDFLKHSSHQKIAYVDLLLLRSHELRDCGNAPEALLYLDEAISFDPSRDDIRTHRLAFLYESLNASSDLKSPDAIELANKVLADATYLIDNGFDTGGIRTMRGCACFSLNDMQSAELDFREALRIFLNVPVNTANDVMMAMLDYSYLGILKFQTGTLAELPKSKLVHFENAFDFFMCAKMAIEKSPVPLMGLPNKFLGSLENGLAAASREKQLVLDALAKSNQTDLS